MSSGPTSADVAPPGGEGEVVIRPYRPTDRDSILAIDFQTGLLGSSMTSILDTAELFTRGVDFYLRRYPSHCFVVEQNAWCGGYVVAAPVDVRFHLAVSAIGNLLRDLMRLPSLPPRDRRWVSSRAAVAARALIGEEKRFRTPRGPRLHINLLPPMRHGGVGSLLLETLFDRLRRDGAASVHANSYESAQNDASGFWRRNGFEEFSRVRTSAWRSFVDDDVDLVCYVRSLK